MNALNQTTAPHLTPSNAAPAVGLALLSPATGFPASMFSPGTVFTVIGQIWNCRPSQAGRFECELHLSVGTLALNGNRDTLSPEIGNGRWVRVKLMRSHKRGAAMHVLSTVETIPAPGETSWIPGTPYHRSAGMRELRRLLSTLEPGLQGVFISLMLDRQVQRQLFWRPAAADHHCYPGGLFDQSVAAAVIANRNMHGTPRERGLATIATLLWDFGKVSDGQLREDGTRGCSELQPHPTTAWRLSKPLERLARSHPKLARDLAALLADPEAPLVAQTSRTAAMRRQVHCAIHESWGPPESFLDTAPDSGSLSTDALPTSESRLAPSPESATVSAKAPSVASRSVDGATERPLNLEWAGGFVDGEGCISIVRQTYPNGRRSTLRLVCSISQNNREVLEHLRDSVGVDGRIYRVKHRPFHSKPVFVLNFDGKKAMAFIALLTPHLIRKREEALTAWAYWIEGRVGARFGSKGLPPELRATRERLYLKMRSLK